MTTLQEQEQARTLDMGGDLPCWSHLVEPPDRDLRDSADIEQLVRTFYRYAAMDDLLGPVFEAAHVDWSVHIPKLIDFWSWQLFGVRGYEGNPLRAHAPLQAATPFRDEHYERWLELFGETVDEHFRGPMAEAAKSRARKMAKALRRLLAGESASPPTKDYSDDGPSDPSAPTTSLPTARA